MYWIRIEERRICKKNEKFSYFMLKSFCALTISHNTSNPFAQLKSYLESIEFQLFSTSTIIVLRWEVSYIFFMINYFFSIFTHANDTCLALVPLFFIWIHYYQLYSLLLTFSFIIDDGWWNEKVLHFYALLTSWFTWSQ